MRPKIFKAISEIAVTEAAGVAAEETDAGVNVVGLDAATSVDSEDTEGMID